MGGKGSGKGSGGKRKGAGRIPRFLPRAMKGTPVFVQRVLGDGEASEPLKCGEIVGISGGRGSPVMCTILAGDETLMITFLKPKRKARVSRG